MPPYNRRFPADDAYQTPTGGVGIWLPVHINH